MVSANGVYMSKGVGHSDITTGDGPNQFTIDQNYAVDYVNRVGGNISKLRPKATVVGKDGKELPRDLSQKDINKEGLPAAKVEMIVDIGSVTDEILKGEAQIEGELVHLPGDRKEKVKAQYLEGLGGLNLLDGPHRYAIKEALEALKSEQKP